MSSLGHLIGGADVVRGETEYDGGLRNGKHEAETN